MFKIAAVLGLVAGGAGYAVYEYTDLFGCNDHSCPLGGKSCCLDQQKSVTPECYQQNASCCEESGSCCESGSRVSAIVKGAAASSSCCAAKSHSVPTQLAACAGTPAAVSANLACEECADCGACCSGSNAKAAIAGAAMANSTKAGK